MIRFFRELHFIPIAAVASACLLTLIAADLLLDRGASNGADIAPSALTDAKIIHARPAGPRASDPQGSWAQQMFNFPGPNGPPAAPADSAALPVLAPLSQDNGQGKSEDTGNADIITGSIGGTGSNKSHSKAKGEGTGKSAKSGAAAATKKSPPVALPDGIVIPSTPGPSAAERAILERLSERRQELDKRARELDIREGLIAEAEKRVDLKLSEIKQATAQLAVAQQQKDRVEAAHLKGLVTMYENMKPRDAAKIFDRLELDVLLEVASRINPRNMSEIMAQMSPDRAERLTVDLASRAKPAAKDANANLPKIQGQPTTQ